MWLQQVKHCTTKLTHTHTGTHTQRRTLTEVHTHTHTHTHTDGAASPLPPSCVSILFSFTKIVHITQQLIFFNDTDINFL